MSFPGNVWKVTLHGFFLFLFFPFLPCFLFSSFPFIAASYPFIPVCVYLSISLSYKILLNTTLLSQTLSIHLTKMGLLPTVCARHRGAEK